MFVIILEFCNVSGVVNIKDTYLPVLQNLGIYTNILKIRVLYNRVAVDETGHLGVLTTMLQSNFNKQKRRVC